MKRFRFSLQAVAVLRAHREMRAQQVFAGAMQAFNRADEVLVVTRARVARFEASIAAGRAQRFSAFEETQALAAYRRDRISEADAERAMLNAQTLMQQRRSEYLEAHRKVEVVKRLEEKARAAHRVASAREEQAEFDDFATRRARSRQTLLSV
jgi:flagellar export protein FliJ